MKFYTIGVKKRECYGHGDFGDEITIRALGSYGTGGFPPLFTTRELARKFIQEKRLGWGFDEIVELTVAE